MFLDIRRQSHRNFMTALTQFKCFKNYITYIWYFYTTIIIVIFSFPTSSKLYMQFICEKYLITALTDLTLSVHKNISRNKVYIR